MNCVFRMFNLVYLCIFRVSNNGAIDDEERSGATAKGKGLCTTQSTHPSAIHLRAAPLL